MTSDSTYDRRFFHSFPRPKANESKHDTLERGLRILSFMKDCGLILAPEIVQWNVSTLSGTPNEHLSLLQRRACFTELSLAELSAHRATFGPIALSFDIATLRSVGATPVIYVPQGIDVSALSQISTFCVRGAYHTRYVLRQLEELKEESDPVLAAKKYKHPIPPDYKLILKNPDHAGNIAAQYEIPASSVRDVLQFVGFNNIPFNQSIAVLNVFLNMFYPADNTRTDEELGYYRQREWRLIAGDINLNGRPVGRNLSTPELTKLQNIDRHFWTHKLTVEGIRQQRSDLALVYEPVPDWNFFEQVEAIFVPEYAIQRVCAIVDNKVAVRPNL